MENAIIRELHGEEQGWLEGTRPVKVSIGQFYGIEINDFAVAVARTALWIAESQMLRETEQIVGREMDFLPLRTSAHIVEGNALRMDWGDVVPKEQLNYIMGNPPFVGARNQTENQKSDISFACLDKYNKTIDKAGFVDYVGGWYYKSAKFIDNTDIQCAFVSTNSICQGEQVSIIWKNLKELYNIAIDFAYQTFVWNNEANEQAHVHCIIICFSQNSKGIKWLFDNTGKGKTVSHINGYLLNAPDCFIARLSKSLWNAPKITNGNRAYDGNNLVLTKLECEDLIKAEPLAEKYIRKYFMGADLLHNEPRYVLWLQGCSPAELKMMPRVLKRVESVRAMRIQSKNVSTQKAADSPMLFQMICQPKHKYLAFPRVSSQRRAYIPMCFLDADCICGDKLIIIPDADLYLFGILMSSVHNAWIRVFSGRLKSDFSYSSSVYNSFAMPEETMSIRKSIVDTAQGILDARALYPESSLADLYDMTIMPPELRKAHRANDVAVLKAYGFAPSMPEAEIVAALMKKYQEVVGQE